jgi:hypothetical protein
MTELFIIEKIINDINNNITNLSRLNYEIESSLIFFENSLDDIKINHPDNNYRKYLMTILEKSKLAMYNFKSRLSETPKFTFIEIYSFYEIIANVLQGINIYTKSTQLTLNCMYSISDDEYIVLEKN